ncbi:MAG: 2-oxoglutarate dehydrogenase E1 component [Proteobacteria bacterium]|nr:2-oxoglutarate dehydrogenase E1 component [Pseudomonadota bacterium]
MKGVIDGGKFTYANGTNVAFLESLYQDYKKNPESLDASWRLFFEGYEFAASGAGSLAGAKDDTEARVEDFINLFRRLGHLSAHLDPLSPKPELDIELLPKTAGLAAVSDQQEFHPATLPVKGPISFRDVRSLLHDTYTRTFGADFRDTTDNEAVEWLQQQMETCRNRPEMSDLDKRHILRKLTQTEGFERFLQDRYLGQKRFSIEGLDTMLVLLDVLADDASKQNIEELCLGMAHRGRLNVLCNFMGKPYELMIKEFEGSEIETYGIDGDVKYHKGYASVIDTMSGLKLRAYLSPNPSHLEAVNPVVEGFTRARQRMLKDQAGSKVLPLLIHGDASFIGQGLVAETLNLSELSAYKTGGTIHVISNNQVGFTTDPSDARSCRYSSDIAKIVRAPVFHVNADDPEAVVWAARLALNYRQKFNKDVVIDLIGYRRHGHNETDEPSFTQPLMYKIIRNHPTVLTKFSEKLIAEKVMTADAIALEAKNFRDMMQAGMEKVRAGQVKVLATVPRELENSTKHVKATEEDLFRPTETAIKKTLVQEIVASATRVPEGFKPNSKIERLLKSRQEMLDGEGLIDWGLAEFLAYGSLALEGKHVRLSGQDCKRGTFSHRHAVIRDAETGQSLSLLNQLSKDQAEFEVINSPLSEQGVMGFEFGYSVADREALVLWEAQFGDFCNGAQIIIDQFLAASEAKWKQASGLVLLLPHGYEGMGPEHSSARPERFLQLCGDNNIQVANLTSPAQLFHILRRQLYRGFRKPLVIMTPKSLLRHPACVSKIKDFTEGRFVEVLDDSSPRNKAAVSRVLFCTGKIFFELDKERLDLGMTDQIALVRVEQLYPFAEQQVAKILGNYPAAQEVFWVQEEPANMGAWTFIRHRLEALCTDKQKLLYCGRRDAGTTAEGYAKVHEKEQKRILLEALTLPTAVDKKAKKNK